MPSRNLFIIGIALIVSLACYSVAAKNHYAQLIAEVLELTHEKALVPKSKDELFESAMRGMLQSIDENSDFLAHQRYRNFEEDMQQRYGGVGMYFNVDPETRRFYVVSPIPNSPAYQAGIRAGDEIVAIDGQHAIEMNQEDAKARIRGPINSTVELQIRRNEQQLLTINVPRQEISIPFVFGDTPNPDGSWNFYLEQYPKFGYIRLIQFGDRSAEELRDALQKIDGRVDGLILDLRRNAGGYLNSAVEICDMFLERPVMIVQTRDRHGNVRSTHESGTEHEFDPRKPMVVLVDRWSASASEIVAACLQDHGRAVVIGEKTYGKGTVQDVLTIRPKESSVKLTTASYWRPSGRNIDRSVSEPDGDDWGVDPSAGFAIEQTIDDLQAIAIARNRRDRELMAKAGSIMEPEEDENEVPLFGPAIPEVKDQPMERAIEYLKSKTSKQMDAAA